MLTKLTKEILQFDLKDGETVQAMPVEKDFDGTTYILVDCLKDESGMNETNTTEGGYDASMLRKKLNSEILERFPDELREHMLPVYKNDLLTIPAEADLFGKNCWEPMKDRRNRITFQGHQGGWEWYWLRDVVSAANFALVNGHGHANCSRASNGYGIRPAFKI